MDAPFKSGYVALLGRPNVGKSSLLNALVGQKISIVSPKPQTTRTKILGIHSSKEGQILFLDSPGLQHRDRKALNAAMIQSAYQASDEADLLLYMVEPTEVPREEDLATWKTLVSQSKPCWIVINKIDQVGGHRLAQILDTYFKAFAPHEIFAISALKGKGLENLVEQVLKILPEGPRFYDDDQVTDQSERQLVAELIREAAIGVLKQELPYSLAVTIDTFKDETRSSRGERGTGLARPSSRVVRGKEQTVSVRESFPLTVIEATIHIERESQKGIVIGAKGEMLKIIGTRARLEIERLLGRKFFMKLFVRVTDGWTEDPRRLKELISD